MVRALVLFGLGGTAAGISAWLLKNPYPWILAARVLQGIGGGGTYQLALALAGDIYTGKERSRAVGYFQAANGLGKVVAPLLGSAAALLAWFAPFFLYGLLAWPAALLVWFVCQEPPPSAPPEAKTYIAELKQVWSKRGLGLAACFAAGFLALFLFFGLLSYFVRCDGRKDGHKRVYPWAAGGNSSTVSHPNLLFIGALFGKTPGPAE